MNRMPSDVKRSIQAFLQDEPEPEMSAPEAYGYEAQPISWLVLRCGSAVLSAWVEDNAVAAHISDVVMLGATRRSASEQHLGPLGPLCGLSGPLG